ncbi:MAG: trypsin-like peptidase domain-containing protein [Planctomycetota bacterium]
MRNDPKHLNRLRAMLEQVGASTNDKGLEKHVQAPEQKSQLEGISTTSNVQTEHVLESLDILQKRRDKKIDQDRRFELEAIVMPYHRPVVDIVKDRMRADQLTKTWQSLAKNNLRKKLESTFLSVGRINVPNILYAGTGFIVGDDLLMTNRHVANLFAMGVGTKTIDFQPGLSAELDFYHENGEPTSETLNVLEIAMIHPFWDLALLRVSGIPSDRSPLVLCPEDPASLLDRDVIVVGYPGYDPKGDAEFQRVQRRVFRDTYYVKRMQPGKLKKHSQVSSFANAVDAVTHDCSTLGGNSGSAVILVPNTKDEPAQVVGLHFAGSYLKANYAVPAYDIAMDRRVVEAGVKIGSPTPQLDDARYQRIWEAVDEPETIPGDPSPDKSDSAVSNAQPSSQSPLSVNPAVNQSPSASSDGRTISWTIPLQISVNLGDIEASIQDTRSADTAAQDSSGSPGTSSEFLFSRAPKFPAVSISSFDLNSLGSDRFDWKAALSTALASNLVYEDGDTVTSTCETTWGFSNCEFIARDGTECFIASTNKVVLLAFRGTKETTDWITNLNLVGTTKDYGRVHRGFLGAFEVVRPMLQEAISETPGLPIVLTGHSLGGALATIAAAEWKNEFPIRNVYTFGQPAVGKGDFQGFIKRSYDNQFFRFVNDTDIVTMVPPTYQHVGSLFHFDGKGALKPQNENLMESLKPEVSGLETMDVNDFKRLKAQMLLASTSNAPQTESLDSAVQLEGFFPSVSDHAMDRYIERIAAQI